jgi:hypothetical protein
MVSAETIVGQPAWAVPPLFQITRAGTSVQAEPKFVQETLQAITVLDA